MISEHQSYKAQVLFLNTYIPSFRFSEKGKPPKLLPVRGTLLLFGGPQVNERHDGRVAVEQVLFLYLITPPQYKVPSDDPVTSNLPISEETE